MQNDLEIGIKAGHNKTNNDKTSEDKNSTLTFYNSSSNKQHHEAMKKLWQQQTIKVLTLPELK